jgi:hypothetical protein
MKLICTAITLLLFTFSVHAQFKLEITPSDNKYASMSIDCQDQARCDEKLIKWIDKQKVYKGDWSENQADSIVSKTESDLEGNSVTKYFKPSNFSVNLVDITEQLADAALDKAIADKLACGEKAIKFIAKSNVKKNLSKGQIKQMVKTYSDIFDLLKAGAIDTALEDMQNATVDGTILTSEDKTSIINFLTNC